MLLLEKICDGAYDVGLLLVCFCLSRQAAQVSGTMKEQETTGK